VGGTVNMYGDAKTGKSYAAIQLAAAITGTMHDWLGFAIAQTGPVLYVQLDTPRNLWMDRLAEIRDAGYDISKIHFADRESLDTWPFNILNPEHFKRLRAEVDRVKAVAVIVDVLKEAHQADENSSTEMQPVIAALQNVCRPACLIILSHSRKAQMEGGPDLVNDQRGSNYVPTRMDSILRFTKKHLLYIGRACEEGSIRAKRLDCGLWAPEMAEIDAHIVTVLADPNLKTRSAQARVLAAKIGRSEEACRSLLQRRAIDGTTPAGQAAATAV
jgi:RecA-family ATPase